VIVVDTSVWVAALRSETAREATALRALLEADDVGLPVPVRAEILSGASRADAGRLGRLLSALPILYPTDDTWRLIEGWIDRAGRAGEHFGIGDLLIAGLCAEAGALIWSLDADFQRMGRLKLVELYDP
jgi:predicted nucleic acid-binding protein